MVLKAPWFVYGGREEGEEGEEEEAAAAEAAAAAAGLEPNHGLSVAAGGAGARYGQRAGHLSTLVRIFISSHTSRRRVCPESELPKRKGTRRRFLQNPNYSSAGEELETSVRELLSFFFFLFFSPNVHEEENMRQEVARRLQLLLALWSVLLLSLGSGFPTRHKSVAHKGHGHGGGVQYVPGTLEQQNQVQSLLPEPHGPQRRWSHPQHRSVGVLPQPEPEEETKPFILDLQNFPDLANGDMNSQNPNIQVTIEVVDDPQMEVEMDLAKEKEWLPSSSSSPSSTVDWLGGKKLFWPLFWSYTDADFGEDSNSRSGAEETGEEEEEEEDYSLDYGSEEPLPSGVGGDWDTRWNEGWDPMQSYYEKETDEWTSWSPCSVTCGHGERKRTKSCGYSCTLTEASRCDLEPCPGDVNTVAEPFPFEMENGTESFGTDVDSCEKWLNCKSEFLQRYLHQVLSELPSCPCSYPSEVGYTVVSVHDETRGRQFRWRDASAPKERLDIYKPSARSCIRSALSGDLSTLAAQHCCYDERGRLITRGKGAGTPNLISTEFSPELHFKVDVLPWILCKGDWSRFHAVRPPNNGLSCPANPHEDVFMNELEEAREY